MSSNTESSPPSNQAYQVCEPSRNPGAGAASDSMDSGESFRMLYTPLPEALEELERRRENLDLQSQVLRFQAEHQPAFLLDAPTAILTRCIHSADHDLERLESMILGTGLTPQLLEVSGDRFTSINRDKYRRGKLSFDFGSRTRALRVMEFNYEGKVLGEIPDLTGRRLVDYHRLLLKARHPAFVDQVRDISEWFLAAGKIPPGYLHYLSLSIVHGIIFENFLLHDPEESRFIRERVIPSFLETQKLFGVKPLIVRLFNESEEKSERIWQYPGALYQTAHQLIKRPARNPDPACHPVDSGGESPPSEIGNIPSTCSWQNPKTIIRNTKHYGRGVFARRRIVCGDILFLLHGPLLNRKEELRLPPGVADKPIEISPWFSISPRSLEELETMPQHLVNHSCHPNAGFGGQLFLVAMRDIEKGEEVTFDYAMCLRSNNETEFRMECLCGAENCRKVVSGGDWEIPDLQVRYEGYFQWYLQTRIREKVRVAGPAMKSISNGKS